MIQDLYQIWNIDPAQTESGEFTGYESVYNQLDAFDKAQYDRDPEGTIERVYEIYRSINIVPIVYFTHKGLVDAVRKFSKLSYNNVEQGKIGLGNNRGQTINRFLFPNMMTAEPKGRGSNSLRDRFFDERKLKRAIRICFEFRTGERLLRPTQLRTALELVTGENVTNFKAQNAKAIAEHLCPVLWGRVYDYSCGYGGRLLGIGSSNFKYDYVGVEPNTETVKFLNYLNDIVDEATGVRGTIVQSVSEEYQPEDIDLAFSSPPYFNLEKYSNEETQCMVQFKTEDQWFEGYVAPTMENIKRGLNDDGIFATNIADYKSYDRAEPYEVTERWIKTAEKIGFKHVETIKMMLNTRPGVGNDRKQGREKWEGVYVFRKN